MNFKLFIILNFLIVFVINVDVFLLFVKLYLTRNVSLILFIVDETLIVYIITKLKYQRNNILIKILKIK